MSELEEAKERTLAFACAHVHGAELFDPRLLNGNQA
jgi:hypothetical protein